MRVCLPLAANAILFATVQLAFAAEPEKPATPAAEKTVNTERGDKMIAEYFRLETAKLREACLADIKTLDDWQAKREEYRRQLREMLGLDPLPERTPLNAVTTGKVEKDDFVVENIHFQSKPGLYVTGNLYLPKKIEGRLPTILYLCGHGEVKKNNISYGNKVHYQHHGAWFARNGYVCLVIDSLQLGEIEGIHHGTYKYDMWWWLNRGYTPAGVEAWNCMRALDYLETRPEVDKQRFGATGRSGGGAYTWWITALDDRIKCAVPVAGITDLQNHVVDGCVEGHCDCMFFSNTYQWDYPLVAALVAPRPLLIGNTDRDPIFPFDGVVRTYEKARGVYSLYKATDKIGLAMGPGPHKDTPELQVAAFRWFDVHLKGKESKYETPAAAFFEPEELKVFKDALPADQVNTKIQETFVPAAPSPALPKDKDDWAKMRDGWMTGLKEKTFRAWPKEECPLDVKEVFSTAKDGIRFAAYDYTSQPGIRLRFYLARADTAESLKPEMTIIHVLDDHNWKLVLSAFRAAFADNLDKEWSVPADQPAWKRVSTELKDEQMVRVYALPRGIGPTQWNQDSRKNINIRRRFYLLGQTLAAQQVYDIRRALQAARSRPEVMNVVLSPENKDAWELTAETLYASLFEPDVKRLRLPNFPTSHSAGPYFLNIDKVYSEIDPALAMAAERYQVSVTSRDRATWYYAGNVATRLLWNNSQFQRGVEMWPPGKENGK